MLKNSERFVALSYRDFRILWAANFLSMVGSQMQVVGQSWQMYLITHSPVALGLVGLCATLPMILFSVLSGSCSDRFDRKKILLITQGLLAILAFAFAIATQLHLVTPWIIYTATALSASGFAFVTPAQQSFIPKLVKPHHLANALSLNYITRQTALILGPMIAGFVIAMQGVELIYYYNAVSFLILFIGLLFIKTSGKATREASMKVTFAIKEGWEFIIQKPILWSTMLLDFVSSFFSSATSLLPIFAKDVLHVGPQGLGFLYAAPAIGAVLAGMGIAHFGMGKMQGRTILYAVAVYGFATLLFGFSHNILLSCTALMMVGAGDSISTIIRSTVRQLETPDNIRGRVIGINMIFFMGGPQLGEFEAGVLAALVGAGSSVVIGGVCTLVVVCIMGKYIPTLSLYSHELNKS
ncbi:MFS transporter [Candidatus Roizmanbacteria bacterium]|nr:MFS transporter [Candidatus Roizmanbacteria bacterium]